MQSESNATNEPLEDQIYAEMFKILAHETTFSIQILDRLKELVESSQFSEADQIAEVLRLSPKGESDETA